MEVGGWVVVVTGGGSGIGAALAREAVTRGAAGVAVVDVDAARAEATAADLSGSTTGSRPIGATSRPTTR